MTQLAVFVLLVVALVFVGRGVAWLTYRIMPELRDDEDRYGFMFIVGIMTVFGLILLGVLVNVLWNLAGMVAQ